MRLNYVEKGSGTPLILLHGNGEDLTYFTNQVKYFSTNYRVIAVDTRGHGKSPRGEKTFTLKQFAEDLKEFMDQKSISKAILLGFSDGGNIALLFTLKYPDYVEKLILNGADLFPSGVKNSVQIPIVMGYYRASLCALWNKKGVSKKELLGLMVTQPHIDPKQLRKIKIPVLVLVGDRDMIKPRHTEVIARNLRRGKLCVIKGDHFIAKKNSGAFNRAVEGFLLQ